MSDLTEQAQKDVDKIDELFADCCTKLRHLASARFLLTGEIPPIPDTNLSPWFQIRKSPTQ